MMNVKTGQWQKQKLPDLNIGRAEHSSIGIEDQVFVACGYGANWHLLNSMEMFRPGLKTWTSIDILDLTPRYHTVFSQIDQDHLCLLGGVDLGGLRKVALFLTIRLG